MSDALEELMDTMTEEEAQKAYDEAPEVALLEAEIQRILQRIKEKEAKARSEPTTDAKAAEEYASKLRDTTIIPEVYAAHLAGQAHGRKEALEWVKNLVKGQLTGACAMRDHQAARALSTTTDAIEQELRSDG